MNIVILGPAYPFRGGIADTNQALCQSFIDGGHDASLITFTVQYPTFLFPGKTQYTTDSKPKNLPITSMIHAINPFNWINVSQKINTMKPDLVIVRYWLPFLAPCLGSIVRLLNKNIISIAMCDNVIPHEKRMGDQLLTRYFTRAFNGFITLSKTTLEELDTFTKKPKISYPHPINKNLGNRLSQQTARKYLNLDTTGNYLLFFGLIRDYKGLDLTLQAMGIAKIKTLNIQLLVVGEFYESLDKYQELIHHLELENHIKIINEFVPTSEIKYYFSATDMVIQTYKHASQSGVSQLAFNFDCPILVTDVGGLSEIVLHQKLGFVCQKDPTDIADCISDFFTHNRRETFSENIRLEKPKYSWSIFSDKILQLYQTLKEIS